MPLLPLVLWDTPPALELVLAQEGVSFVRVREAHPLAFHAGRFVLYDSRRTPAARVHALISHQHVPIDIDAFRHDEQDDPFAALVDTKAAMATWPIHGRSITERVSRYPKAALRTRLIGRLRDIVARAGGLWARLSPYPYPYRSAFNFRADLDEPYPDVYARFAIARSRIDDCTTHFVSTGAYGDNRDVLRDLARLDTQSHGHFHVVYRDEAANRRNIGRAHARLTRAGIAPVGFAAPEGRWNEGLDTVLEENGYLYSSDFHLGYDDLPFYPWRGGRFSEVLQVPVHPVCEGLFLDAGTCDYRVIEEYLAWVVRNKIDAGEPAFVYGHPERRLGRFPRVLEALANQVSGNSFLWRVTLTEFARWWRWRGARSWTLVAKGNGRHEVQFDDWDTGYPMALEILRGEHVASLPVRGPITPLRLEGLLYERRRPRVEFEIPTPSQRRRGFKAAVRAALDWETVTPIDDIVANSLRAHLKKRLRRWRARTKAHARGGKS
jgi:hypothetical protein